MFKNKARIPHSSCYELSVKEGQGTEKTGRAKGSHLQVDDEDEGRGSYNSKGLIVRWGFPILSHSLKESSIGDEKDYHRGEDAME